MYPFKKTEEEMLEEHIQLQTQNGLDPKVWFGSQDNIVGGLAELLMDSPINDFIHHRFCSIYPRTHSWSHDPFIRVLLFMNFSRLQRMPTVDEAAQTFVLAKDLRLKAPEDIWIPMIPFLTEDALNHWESFAGIEPFSPSTSALSEFVRSLFPMFADVMKDYIGPFEAYSDVYTFYIEPTLDYDCEEAQETLDLPLLEYAPRKNVLPTFDPSSSHCTCGECAFTIQKVQKKTHLFGEQYVALTNASAERDCSALRDLWEPLMAEAEAWMEREGSRVESPIDIFPVFGEDDRLGPSIFDAANDLGIKIGSDLSVGELLRLIVLMHLLSVRPAGDFSSLYVPDVFPKDGIGYLIFPAHDPIAPGSGLQAPELMVPDLDLEVVAGGPWLPDLAGQHLRDTRSKVVLIGPSEEYTISFDKTFYPKYSHPICMPELISGEVPDFLPPRHDITEFRLLQEEPIDYSPDLLIEVSQKGVDGYPLFSVFDTSRLDDYPPDCLAAQLSTTFQERVLQTWWRPSVSLGQKCSHSDLYLKAIRCSLSCEEIILQVQKPSSELLAYMQLLKSESYLRPDVSKTLPQRLRDEMSRRTERLREKGGPFESHHVAFVRCESAEAVLPIVLLAASCGRKVYLINYQECWDCAGFRMLQDNCMVGVAVGTRYITDCSRCLDMKARAADVASTI
ncbi:hypothetical protein SISSUDRAFT_104563 [Sistotremastrum suecicum HHB10207 ss-3]|uniref:Uncharacterized protein n=1 Tax=Sistotremastrum suecicum HHB10207 ss-3 TaxID=1314776 RepID=A0A166B4E2_9AGAM|nr:hypothetical protein SISSUDRAFT_104563 [Sistotremastrum suecicum HHB10207 ss-3]